MQNIIVIDGIVGEWQGICRANAEAQNPFVVINCSFEMLSFCNFLAKGHGYELRGKGLHPDKISGRYEFIPRHYKKTFTSTK